VATLLLLGSGEFEPWTTPIERRVLDAATGDGTVLVIPTASATEGEEVFQRWGRMGLVHYADDGVPAELLELRTREDAQQEELADRVRAASMLAFSGGKPQRLEATLRDTPVWAAALEAIDRGGVYYGCSAGAIVASQAADGRPRGVGTSWLYGLGLVPGVSFGAHWDRVTKFPGLERYFSARVPDGSIFVGIHERTAIVGDGTSWEVEGEGGVVVRNRDRNELLRPGDRFSTRQPRK
jgi:cyanophycinase